MSEEPQGFSTYYRNPGHWDISTREDGRAFRIRGEPGRVVVFDERKDDQKYGRHPRASHLFPTVAAALAFIAFQFMAEEGHP